MPCRFTRAFYKIILGLIVNFRDLEQVDREYYNDLCVIADNVIADEIKEIAFVYSNIDFDLENNRINFEHELIKNGKRIHLSEENKQI